MAADAIFERMSGGNSPSAGYKKIAKKIDFDRILDESSF